jgi:hypothetical protein
LVLEKLKKSDLFKPEKCEFKVTKMDYLGFIIEEGKISMDPTKVQGIVDWPTPRTVKKWRSFLGFCNFYHKFIQNYSNKCKPLNKLEFNMGLDRRQTCCLRKTKERLPKRTCSQDAQPSLTFPD